MRFLTLLIIVVLALGCKKPAEEPVVPTGPQMPARTETGRNIVACRVNGDIHVYRGKPTYFHDDGVRFGKYQVGNELFLKMAADESELYDDNICLFIYELSPEVNKEYTLAASEANKDYARYFIGSGFNDDTYYTKDGSGSVTFSRYDSLVVAGVFEFTAYNPAGQKVEITEGFFDISLKE